MQVTVRKATLDDGAALAGLRWRVTSEHPEYGELDREAFVDSFVAWISEHLSTHLPFIAEVDDELVGVAWLMIAERVPGPGQPCRRCGDVQSVYVVPELRGTGIGAALLDAVLAEAGKLALEHVTVHSNDRATPLYLRAGFEQDQRWLRWEPE
ncbi:GNAT family N-acetyltransferase [Dactylosporangium darangshiense]|uniref:GNAT family N-acetyltransferase n=2 Tax=Dactylosporangium darangshiense TaxID=579108 RepID=A0ABP8CVH4_9ACTN